ncbi:hypothetical protein Taro_048704 [Colocasia esculenta]|uniref:Uncharacterized protein n=1 Tax=Colocasia esculenta TaxID=4460 RepID=A0A843X8V7_COLES|nr:hypothetical protein [Colocasia esculenta]
MHTSSSSRRTQGEELRKVQEQRENLAEVCVGKFSSVALPERAPLRVLLTPLEEFKQYLSTVIRWFPTDEGRLSTDEVYLSTSTEFSGILGSGSRISVDKQVLAVDRCDLNFQEC